MSGSGRSLGLNFFATAFTLSAFFGIFFYASPLYVCVKEPVYFSDAAQALLKNPFPGTVSLLYENTLLFAYFFIGIGLWRLKPWAYRLLMFLLVVEAVEKLWIGIKTGLAQDFFASGQAAGYFIGRLFLLLFFGRKSIRAQFEEAPSAVKIAGQSIEPMPALGPVRGDLTAANIIRQSRHEAGAASEELDRLAGYEKAVSWMVMLAGIIFSLKQRMSLVKGGLFGGLWGIESYVICFYCFRAQKIPTLAGGGLSIGISLALSIFLPAPAEGQWLMYIPQAAPTVLGGLLSGLMTRYNRWFHGSSAGFVWAIFYFCRDFYEKHGWAPSLEKMDLLQILNTSLLILIIGLLGGCLGGLLGTLKSGKNR